MLQFNYNLIGLPGNALSSHRQFIFNWVPKIIQYQQQRMPPTVCRY